MKRLIFILFLGLFLISFVSASECELATPRYGVIQCINSNQEETQNSYFSNFDGDWAYSEINCLSNCDIQSEEDIYIYCSGISWDVSEIYLNGAKRENFPISWNKEDSLIIKGKCAGVLNTLDVPEDSFVQYIQDKIMLYEGWAGSLPNTPISGSEGCVLNKNIEEETEINQYLNPNTGTVENEESSSYSSLGDFPYNWEIGDSYIFVKDWETGIAGISLAYDKNNNGYWCGGQYGSRKIYSVKEIIGNDNSCYSIPQSIYLSNVECCFPTDCIDNFGSEYTCNPNTWECEKTKPCNSQIDCESTFGEGVCESGEIVSWTCNTNNKWGDYAGTCEQESRLVEECPSDCGSKEYYNEEQGKCLNRKDVESSLEQTDTPSSFYSGLFSSKKSSSGGKVILVIFLIIIFGSIGFFIYAKNKEKKKGKQKSKNKK